MKIVVKLPPRVRRAIATELLYHDPRVRGPYMNVMAPRPFKVSRSLEAVDSAAPEVVVLRWSKVQETAPGKKPWAEWHVEPDTPADEALVQRWHAELEAADAFK